MSRYYSRRSFVHSAFAGAACVSLDHVLAQDAAPKRKLRKAVMFGTVRVKGTLMEKFKAIREAGFEGVEPNGGMDQQEVLEALKANNLEAASVCCHTHWKDTLSHPDSEIRKRGTEGLLTTLRNAKAYGTDSILLVPGVVNAEVPYDVAWKRSQECIRQAIPLAQELKVRISIENVWNNFILSPIEMARYIDEFDTPWVGAHFDIGNVYRYGWPEHWIHILGKRIYRLHFKEFDTDKMMKEGLRAGFDCEFLAGKNDWKAIMHALDDVGYTGWCIAEQRMGINPADMKKLTAAMDQMFAM